METQITNEPQIFKEHQISNQNQITNEPKILKEIAISKQNQIMKTPNFKRTTKFETNPNYK